MNIIVFDTETINLEKPFCYNIGYTIYNTEDSALLLKRDFVVEQVWHNPMLYTTSYYACKRDLYVKRLKGRSCLMDKFGYITQQMARDIKTYEVAHGFAYNSAFDEKVFAFNCDWFKCINPLETVQVHDIRGHVHETIAFTKNYQSYCEKYRLFTDSGNYSTTAETVYRWLSQDHEFEEEHTALSDSIIETMILSYCCDELGLDWASDYKVYSVVPRKIRREFTVIDASGNRYKFDYTSKSKLRGEDGIKFMIKE